MNDHPAAPIHAAPIHAASAISERDMKLFRQYPELCRSAAPGEASALVSEAQHQRRPRLPLLRK